MMFQVGKIALNRNLLQMGPRVMPLESRQNRRLKGCHRPLKNQNCKKMGSESKFRPQMRCSRRKNL